MKAAITRRDFLKIGGTAAVALALPGCQLPGVVKRPVVEPVRVPVLMYHDIADITDDYTVSPAIFASHMEWLYSNGYRALSPGGVRGLEDNDLERAVIITFDDGYASFMDYAFPLFKEYGFRATINIIGRHAGSYIRVGVNRPMLSWDEYRHLFDSGLVDPGCHTFNLHTGAGVLGVPASVLRDDITLFQETIKKRTGRIAEIMAWPYGRYDAKAAGIAMKAGFKYILTSNEGYWSTDGDPYEVPRLNINSKLDLASFQQYMKGK